MAQKQNKSNTVSANTNITDLTEEKEVGHVLQPEEWVQ